MPTPNPGESRDDFMGRCVPMVMDEGKSRDQAVAMCSAKMEEHMGAKAKGKLPKLIAMSAPVAITAGEGEGEKKGPARFTATFYTGGKLNIEGWDMPVVVDLAGLKPGNVLVANLDHDRTKRVGNFAVANDGKSLVANGTATARTAARDEVVESAIDGYQWQSSLEVNPHEVEELKAGKKAEVNGQTVEGPAYITRTGTLKGFAFVSHGADDNTTATIAASAASTKGKAMRAEVKKWAEKIYAGVVDFDHISDEMVATIEANYDGSQPVTPKKRLKLDDGIEAKQAEQERVDAITDIALNACDKRPHDITAIKELAQKAIDGKWEVDKFRLELLEAALPLAHTVFRTRPDERLSNRILTAALCEVGRLPNLDKHFKDEELQAAHDRFPSGITLGQLFHVCAEANGYRGNGASQVTIETQRAAFRMVGQRQIHAGGGFSTIDIATIVSATANKFMMDGWNAVDQTPLRIAYIKPVKNFQLHTTVSLTDSLRYEQLAPGGEIVHGTLDEITYTDQADTYAKMLAITRRDIINDDAGALTSAPRKLGNGAMKLLNHIFWTEFLSGVSTSFFASGNSNINTGVADMTVGGLDATETIFMNQTNPDGTPLGLQPAIILVPTALKNKALTLMGSMLNAAAITSYAAATGDKNPFVGRFRVESSPYISNSSYTGNTSTAWWMLANPSELPVITIAALNGRVEPTVDTADADFNTLGVQMRGYCDVGVNFTEYRAGVHADGGSS